MHELLGQTADLGAFDATFAPSPSAAAASTANVLPMSVFAVCLLVVSALAQVCKHVELMAAYHADLLCVTLGWYVVSISLTLCNKFFFHHLYGGLEYPLLLSMWHMIIKGCLAAVFLKLYLIKEEADFADARLYGDGEAGVVGTDRWSGSSVGSVGVDQDSPLYHHHPKASAVAQVSAFDAPTTLALSSSVSGSRAVATNTFLHNAYRALRGTYTGETTHSTASSGGGTVLLPATAGAASSFHRRDSGGLTGNPSAVQPPPPPLFLPMVMPAYIGGDVTKYFWNRHFMHMAVPIGVCTGLDICLSNWAISNYITVSLYTIVKTSVLVFTYMLSVMLRMQPARWSLSIAIVVVCAGIGMAATADGVQVGSVGRVTKGVSMTAMASAMGALRWVLTEAVFREQHQARSSVQGKFQLLLCISPAAAVSVGVLAVPMELPHLLANPLFADASKCAWMFVIASALAFVATVLIFLEYALVQMASALTLAVAGHLKEVLVVAFAVAVFAEPCPRLKANGMLLALTGSLAYMYIKAGMLREREYSEVPGLEDDDSTTTPAGRPPPVDNDAACV